MKSHTPALWLITAGLLCPAIFTPARACENCRLKDAGLYIGESTLLGNGTVRSWVVMDKARRPHSVGITFSETALEGLPEYPPANSRMPGYEYRLALPAQARFQGIDNIGVDWNPLGHEPIGIYDVPHFDFHFYTIPVAARDRITLIGADLKRCAKPVSARYVPAGFIQAPKTEIPKMGSHWVSLASPEFQKKPFTHTWIWGSYDGKQSFVEPMISLAFLKTRPNVTQPIPQPKAFAKPGWYPTTYQITYNATRKEYTVSLEGLKYRAATNVMRAAAE